jgi:hypothetical protein
MTGDYMGKFIYIFSEEDRDRMINLGYQLLCEQPSRGIYVFLFDQRLNFADGVKAVFTDTLSF